MRTALPMDPFICGPDGGFSDAAITQSALTTVLKGVASRFVLLFFLIYTDCIVSQQCVAFDYVDFDISYFQTITSQVSNRPLYADLDLHEHTHTEVCLPFEQKPV